MELLRTRNVRYSLWLSSTPLSLLRNHGVTALHTTSDTHNVLYQAFFLIHIEIQEQTRAPQTQICVEIYKVD